MAVAITDKQGERREKIEETYGQFAVEDAEFRMRHLWVLDVEAALEEHVRYLSPGGEPIARFSLTEVVQSSAIGYLMPNPGAREVHRAPHILEAALRGLGWACPGPALTAAVEERPPGQG